MALKGFDDVIGLGFARSRTSFDAKGYLCRLTSLSTHVSSVCQATISFSLLSLLRMKCDRLFFSHFNRPLSPTRMANHQRPHPDWMRAYEKDAIEAIRDVYTKVNQLAREQYLRHHVNQEFVQRGLDYGDKGSIDFNVAGIRCASLAAYYYTLVKEIMGAPPRYSRDYSGQHWLGERRDTGRHGQITDYFRPVQRERGRVVGRGHASGGADTADEPAIALPPIQGDNHQSPAQSKLYSHGLHT